MTTLLAKISTCEAAITSAAIANLGSPGSVDGIRTTYHSLPVNHGILNYKSASYSRNQYSSL